MSRKDISIKDFEKLLPQICDKKTSVDPNGWTEKNPLWGHCAVVSLLALDLFGGDLLRVSLKGTKFASSRWHYWNKLPDGTEWDFTRLQFGACYPRGLKVVTRIRKEVMSYPPTVRRYELLKKRFEEMANAAS